MGAKAWHYFTQYRDSIERSLEELRQQEFRTRRFYHSERLSATIEEAIANAGESGTCSILDIERISPSPVDWAACPVPVAVLVEAFGTDRPRREVVASVCKNDGDGAFDDFFYELDRGQACYIVTYDEDRPTEVFFAGWSVD
jgi:hypothetical protein